jgi:N-acetylglucosamine-6-phosphate deacetylase
MLIRNVRLIHNNELTDVRVESGMILEVMPADSKRAEGFDGQKLFIVPGFTDLHVHGAGGADFSCGNENEIVKADHMLSRLGTTSYLATTFYLPDGPNDHLTVLRELFRSGRCPGMKGIHLEGPFIAPAKRGGITPERISPYTPEILEDVFRVCGDALKMMTIAPEMDDSGSLIHTLKSRNVIPSFGHTDANAEETEKALKSGIDHVTHICNAMRPIHHRDPGPIPEIVDSRASAQIIADGVHLAPRMIRFLVSLVGYARCVCITDGMLSSGLPDGEYVYQGKAFRAEKGEARFVHDDGLIGTSLSVREIAARFMKYTGCTLEEGVKTVTENPCRVLGSHPFYSCVHAGSVADLLLIDDRINIHRIWKNGDEVTPL